MQPIIDSNSPKKATNLSINKDLLAEARALKINLSATLEQALTEKVRKARRKQWLQDNKQAIKACNELAEQNGLFADKHRIF
ncbi:type II toxin-antitoxin system CcdA family antitoxin [Dasania sp. GY-MA-18]|uniref:Type II toxin-antitoxin system CcdA family antitoxin n=1 Tax=Dasania phycosphaerae TaxID=2950436 RepID=A0A9J6RQ23_9GAMM|nr:MULTISPECIES: type II toxin-antitoxin system CcdA family antitoxin [Dasania]MCR8923789.1 type II toxin-antitoxin system CcdA family antitoxin [Dasania sp. GY-MA-18]MCZ0866223.1 type II toxin-antitoxin system CcdA family antitoxin [Dasania phycosphaerae]MCZ0869947.1 type II toxin-antitoxin system CcdA family antitoxin [Dasania phycosphaerae]